MSNFQSQPQADQRPPLQPAPPSPSVYLPSPFCGISQAPNFAAPNYRAPDAKNQKAPHADPPMNNSNPQPLPVVNSSTITLRPEQLGPCGLANPVSASSATVQKAPNFNQAVQVGTANGLANEAQYNEGNGALVDGTELLSSQSRESVGGESSTVPDRLETIAEAIALLYAKDLWDKLIDDRPGTAPDATQPDSSLLPDIATLFSTVSSSLESTSNVAEACADFMERYSKFIQHIRFSSAPLVAAACSEYKQAIAKALQKCEAASLENQMERILVLNGDPIRGASITMPEALTIQSKVNGFNLDAVNQTLEDYVSSRLEEVGNLAL